MWAVLHANHNRQGGLRDIATCLDECAKLAQHLLVLYDDEMPGLPVITTCSQVSRFDDLMDKWFRNRLILKLADRQDCANGIKYLHDGPFFLRLNVTSLLLWKISRRALPLPHLYVMEAMLQALLKTFNDIAPRQQM